ncbi:MAG: hypothetical protein AAF714_05255 [Pseudomonadota bacterium]
MRLNSIFTAIFVLVFATQAHAQVTLNTQQETVRFSNHQLGARQQLGWQSFIDERYEYFAAFAIDRNDDRFFGFYGMASMDDARRIALEGCRTVSEAAVPDCIVYDGVRPKGGGPASSFGDGPQFLVWEVAENEQSFLDALRPAQPEDRFFFGVAFSPLGGYGLTEARQSQRLARDQALEDCELAHSTTDQDSFVFELDRIVFNRLAELGFMRCSTVLVLSLP